MDGPAVHDVDCGDGTLGLAMLQCGPPPPVIQTHEWLPVHMPRPGARDAISVSLSLGRRFCNILTRPFDVVTCVTVITFIADPQVALREMARCCALGDGW